MAAHAAPGASPKAPTAAAVAADAAVATKPRRERSGWVSNGLFVSKFNRDGVDMFESPCITSLDRFQMEAETQYCHPLPPAVTSPDQAKIDLADQRGPAQLGGLGRRHGLFQRARIGPEYHDGAESHSKCTDQDRGIDGDRPEQGSHNQERGDRHGAL